MLKELPKEGHVNVMHIFNATLLLEYWPKSSKIAQILMIPKPGKNPMDVSSCRPISLLPTILKVLENLISLYSKNQQRPEPARLDPKPSMWIPTGSLHSATIPPHNRYHQ